MRRQYASDARDDARAIGDPVFELAALAGGALASVSRGGGSAAAARLAESSTALERLTAEQLATRLPAFWMHGRAYHALGQLEPALANLERGIALATSTGRERVLLVLTVESVSTLIELGRLGDANAAAEEGLELACLSGNPRMLLWARTARASASLAAGDVGAALQHAPRRRRPASRRTFTRPASPAGHSARR